MARYHIDLDLWKRKKLTASELSQRIKDLETEVERLNGALNGCKVDFNRERQKVLDLNARIGELEGKLNLAEQELEKDAHNRADKMRENALKRQNDELLEELRELRELRADRDTLQKRLDAWIHKYSIEENLDANHNVEDVV